MTLGLKYVDLGASAGYMLQQNIKNGKLYIKSSTWMNSNNTIPAGSSGSLVLPLSVRNTSIKSLFATFGSQAIQTVEPSYLYGSINPSINSLQYSIPALGTRYPN